jgi:ATP-dependent Lhr-like helicase
MGVISREKRITSKEVNELVRLLMDTPIYEETIKECIVKDFDIKNSVSLLDKIRRGDIKLIVYKGLLKVTRHYLEKYKPKYEVIDRGRMEALSIASHKARILNKYVVLACLDCLNYIDEVRIRDLNDEIRCPLCGSNKIGFSEDSIEDVARVIDLYRQGRENMRRIKIRRLLRSSKIISKFGKVGIFVLASEGISFKDAEEILSREDKLNDKLVKLVIEKSQKNLLQKILRERRGGG